MKLCCFCLVQWSDEGFSHASLAVLVGPCIRHVKHYLTLKAQRKKSAEGYRDNMSGFPGINRPLLSISHLTTPPVSVQRAGVISA